MSSNHPPGTATRPARQRPDPLHRVGGWALLLFPVFALGSALVGMFAVHSLFGIATCAVAGLCGAIPVIIAVQTVLMARHLRRRRSRQGPPIAPGVRPNDDPAAPRVVSRAAPHRP